MGGRGSTSGGRLGGGNGINPKNIKNVTSLVSEREGKTKEVDQVLNVFKDFGNEFPNAQINDILLATIVGKDSNAIGYCDGYNVGINRVYFDVATANTVMDKCIKAKFHPPRGNKSGLEAVTAHEIGHHLTEIASRNMGNSIRSYEAAADKIVHEARRATNHRGVVQMARKISDYATASNSEAIAEAVCDVYCNGSSAKSESKAIYNVLSSYVS